MYGGIIVVSWEYMGNIDTNRDLAIYLILLLKKL